jgi:hypothetical protein
MMQYDLECLMKTELAASDFCSHGTLLPWTPLLVGLPTRRDWAGRLPFAARPAVAPNQMLRHSPIPYALDVAHSF